jgi:hypothetical protein
MPTPRDKKEERGASLANYYSQTPYNQGYGYGHGYYPANYGYNSYYGSYYGN